MSSKEGPENIPRLLRLLLRLINSGELPDTKGAGIYTGGRIIA
jgi:hypothetical protein